MSASEKHISMPEDMPQFDLADVSPARLRFRHYILIASFVLIVVIPTAVSGWLSWNFSGILRQVTASYTVQEHSLGASGGAISVRSAFSGGGAEETAIVRQLVYSEDFYRVIRDQVDLTAIWPQERLVPHLPPRYNGTGPTEEGHRFWQNMVTVNLGSRDQIIRITVSAFDQQSAETLLEVIRTEAERRLNIARTAILTAAKSEAEMRVKQLRAQNDIDRRALTDFRLKNQAIDPTILAGLNISFKNNLRSIQANEEISIAEATASVARRGELIRRSEDRITAIDAYLSNPDATKGRIITTDEAAKLIEEYEPLRLKAEISGISLRAAELSILYYEREMESNKVFLSSVTGGSKATIKVFPQFGPTLLAVLVSCFVMWSAVLLIFYAVRDRK